MKRCSHPEHPHCTVWVMPGEDACAHGHVQTAAPAALPVAGSGDIVPGAGPPRRPHLHVSGFDPRAAGGRQVLKLELRGMPDTVGPQLSVSASSRLRLDGGRSLGFTRTGRGEWLPVFLEFSSRGLEHGQYRIELELHGGPDEAAARTWIATLLILAPRPDAGLHEIHQTFLATHRNVRVSADDASIARVSANLGADMPAGGGRVDIDVSASNAGIAHLDLGMGSGKIDLGFSSIAWDEELFEVDRPAYLPPVEPARLAPQAARHPCPASTACLLFDGAAPAIRHLRLFALDEFVLGRREPGALDADLLLAHHSEAGPAPAGLTRRISARHALIRRGRDGFEIEDVSRYGLLLDGAWPGKHTPAPLRPGMRIGLTASIPGVAVLEVAAILPNGIVLRRADAGTAWEAFYLLDPEHRPGPAGPHQGAHAPGLPLLFHCDGGFWRRDPASGEAMPLTPAAPLCGPQFTARPYPDMDGVFSAASAGTPAPSPQSAPLAVRRRLQGCAALQESSWPVLSSRSNTG